MPLVLASMLEDIVIGGVEHFDVVCVVRVHVNAAAPSALLVGNASQ
jgi:hypothetical protein